MGSWLQKKPAYQKKESYSTLKDVYSGKSALIVCHIQRPSLEKYLPTRTLKKDVCIALYVSTCYQQKNNNNTAYILKFLINNLQVNLKVNYKEEVTFWWLISH